MLQINYVLFIILQGVVTEVTDAKNREMLFEANEDFIIKVQALARGYMAKKKYQGRMTYLKEQEPAVVKIQVRFTRIRGLENYFSKALAQNIKTSIILGSFKYMQKNFNF